MSTPTENIRRDGYAIIDEVFDAEIRHAWRTTLDHLRESEQASVYSTVSWYRHILENCPDETLRAVTRPRLLDLIEKLIGPFVQLDGVSLIAFQPVHDADSLVRGWHRDRWAEFPNGVYTVPRAIHVLCYLQDITDETGPLRVIPGSHIRPVAIAPEDETRPHPDEVLLYPRAGQAAVLHNKVLHSGSLHTASESRSFCSICFNHCWMRQPDDFAGPNCRRLRAQAADSGDARLMRLLGLPEPLGAGLNRSNCGFLRPDETYWNDWRFEDRAAALAPSPELAPAEA